MEHPRVVVCSSLCVGKKDKKEIKTLGSPSGALDKVLFYIRETGKVLWGSITTLLPRLRCLLGKS